MYEAFYGFSEKPFSLLPDPGFLYLGERHQEALSLLEYGLMYRAGIILITGQIGCGKTTLIRHLIQNQDVDMVVGNITNTHHSFGELLKWVMLAFDLEYKGKDRVELYHDLIEYLNKQHRAKKRVTLIIDEAQNMGADTLEELRMLSNINVDKDQVLQIILVGQPELRDLLLKPELMQLTQRISVDYFLEALSPREAFEYIRHRIEVVGGDPDIIDLLAFKSIYEHSNGIPRLINTICDTAFVYGFAEQSEKITKEIVDEVLRDKSKGRILPLAQSEQLQNYAGKGIKHVSLG
ncbi:MAG TPA: AAA family ATPase [Gammaproteobacteria bacterium]|nr:AAA family ATPase [Gammaproteobacteria bacterium]